MKFMIDFEGDAADFCKSIGGIQPVQVESDNDERITSLENEIKSLKLVSSAMKRELIELRTLLLKQQLDDDEAKKTTEPSFNGLTFSKSVKREFKYIKLNLDTWGFDYVTPNNRNFHSNFTAFDVLLLKGLEHENSWRTWSDLSRMTGMRIQPLQRLAYNIAIGFFDKFDLAAADLLNFSKEYGLLYINNKKTDVPIKTVKYIVNCMLNSNNPYTTLLKLKKSRECSDLLYNVIGTNYKNEQLTGLLNDFIEVPVENNPEKRKEMGL